MKEETFYSFDPFALDAEQRVLLRDGAPLRLTPREVDVLIALVERHGQIVDKGRLLDRVWQGLSVEECNLSQHVAALRRVLGDDARVPIYIETIPRRGYRFVAPVVHASRPRGEALAALTAAATEPAPSPVPQEDPPGPTAPRPTPLPLAAHAASALSTPQPTPPPLAPAEPPPADLAPREPTPPPFALPVPPSPSPGAPPPARRLRRLAQTGVLTLVALGLGFGLIRARARSTAPVVRTLAVLPFANLTGDSHQEHIAETLTAALRSDLRRASGVRVETAHPGAGHEVAGVDAFVETAVLSGEGRLRVAAELIDARTNRLLWAEVIETNPVAFLEAEDRIVRAVLSHLDGPRGRDDAQVRSGDRAAARREYALARQYLSRRTPQVVEESIEHFTASAKLDPTNGLAFAGLADAYLLGAQQRVLSPAAALASAETAARRALELDPNLAEAHGALGEIAAARWNFEAAEASYRRALALDQAIGKVHERYAALLTVQDRHDEAIAEARVARDLDPSCPAAATNLAATYYHAGRNDAAIEQALAALRITPRFAAAYDVLGWAHRAKGLDAEAIAAFGEAVRLSGRNPSYVAALARAHASGGARKQARQLLAELERSAATRAASPLELVEVLAALGETDEALRQVERAVAEGAPWLPQLKAGLSLTALHDQARFRELRARMRRGGAPAASSTDGLSISERPPVQACLQPGRCPEVPHG